MNKLEFSTLIKCGNSRRKVEDIYLEIKDIKCVGGDIWQYHVVLQGAINEDKVLDGNSCFDCLVLGLAFLRQSLRMLKQDNPKIKFFEIIDKDLEEITIEDIFCTHDCITDEMEDMMDWATKHGYSEE